jgi:hypothetical protein
MGRIEHTLLDEGRGSTPTDLRPSPATTPYQKKLQLFLSTPARPRTLTAPDERLVAHAGLLPLLLSGIPNDESLEALRHILLFPDERRVALAGGPITHPIAADEARAPTLSCSPRPTTIRRPSD